MAIKLLSVTKPIPYKTSEQVNKAFQQIKLDHNLKNINEVFEMLIKKFNPKYLQN